MSNERRPILGRGENLVEPITKSSGGGPKKYPRSYSEALELVTSNLKQLESEITKIPEEKRMNKIVVTVRLHEDFLAKSYTPETFFRNLNYENIGSRKWITDSGKESKMNFIKLDPNNIDNNIKTLTSFNTKSFKDDLRKIEEINILNVDETVLGFEESWDNGRVELVLHPFEETQLVLEKLYSLLDLTAEQRQKVKYKKYDNGPLFVSTIISKDKLKNVAEFNPLRTVHPLKVEVNSFSKDPFIVKVKEPVAPPIPTKKIGIIDGGVNLGNPFFSSYVTQNFEVASPPSNMFTQHGSNVASMALYGDLYGMKKDEQLMPPILGIESIRVFPTSDSDDIDLYESIDLIEEAVPKLKDVDVFNVSVGPIGNILDDDISRFTTALDQLSYDYKKLFTVAVGNTGSKPSPLNRIQSPADMVNGIGVGSYSINQGGDYSRAIYSSVGFGREGCKIKPDLCEHGGSTSRPLQVLNSDSFSMNNVMGTSFSAPVVAKKAAELMLKSKDVGVLTARALLTQNASNEIQEVNHELGYGACISRTDDILTCSKNKVTILYNNEMSVKNSAKLRIPLPQNSSAKKYKISWTIVSDTQPNPLFAEGYTSTALEDTFYPNENKFNYRLGKTSYARNIVHQSKEIQELKAKGFNQSTIQASSTPMKFASEADRRNEQKWDTVVKRSKVCLAKTLDYPFLTVHALDRETTKTRVRYSVAITVEALNYNGDLYDEIMNEYRVLQPINVQLENELRISNKF
ncbi:S8 family peptidase [Vagococcus coleopterorum]|uniref:S8 family peptidase n=1 Tax=Vagococcus coleopterorum TaxID=2714946 RepID=A0A6G8AMJ2_9ENTE|nr:S8 family peptidase [Vagococcus coleopterorum]QIL46190.1 S8 family peptidase [Vagococcus coleopterorum]